MIAEQETKITKAHGKTTKPHTKTTKPPHAKGVTTKQHIKTSNVRTERKDHRPNSPGHEALEKGQTADGNRDESGESVESRYVMQGISDGTSDRPSGGWFSNLCNG